MRESWLDLEGKVVIVTGGENNRRENDGVCVAMEKYYATHQLVDMKKRPNMLKLTKQDSRIFHKFGSSTGQRN